MIGSLINRDSVLLCRAPYKSVIGGNFLSEVAEVVLHKREVSLHLLSSRLPSAQHARHEIPRSLPAAATPRHGPGCSIK